MVNKVPVLESDEREMINYPWPSLIAFVYGARKDMPLEPLEFLSALLLWSASVPTGFHHQLGES